jgi:hypothetical protein
LIPETFSPDTQRKKLKLNGYDSTTPDSYRGTDHKKPVAERPRSNRGKPKDKKTI